MGQIDIMKGGLSILILILSYLPAGAQNKPAPASVLATGKAIYAQQCMTCHQVDGVGAQNMIPPLVKTDYVLGDKGRLIRVVLYGITGEIKVNGDTYAGEMPAHKTLTDSEIAAVLTYVRNSFGNKASAVSGNEVKKIRATNK